MRGGGTSYPPSLKGEVAMQRIINGLRFVDSLSEWTGKAVSFFIPFLSIIVTYEVVARYGFGRPTIWVHEMSDMFFGTFIIIGGAYTFYHGGHVNMDVIYGRLSPRTKAVLDLITSFFTFSFLLILIWKGGQSAWKSLVTLERDSTMWAPLLYPIKLMLPLGAILLLLQVLAKFIRDFMTAIRRSE